MMSKQFASLGKHTAFIFLFSWQARKHTHKIDLQAFVVFLREFQSSKPSNNETAKVKEESKIFFMQRQLVTACCG